MWKICAILFVTSFATVDAGIWDLLTDIYEGVVLNIINDALKTSQNDATIKDEKSNTCTLPGDYGDLIDYQFLVNGFKECLLKNDKLYRYFTITTQFVDGIEAQEGLSAYEQARYILYSVIEKSQSYYDDVSDRDVQIYKDLVEKYLDYAKRNLESVALAG